MATLTNAHGVGYTSGKALSEDLYRRLELSFNDGIKVSDIATLYKVSLTTAKRAKRRWLQGNILPGNHNLESCTLSLTNLKVLFGPLVWLVLFQPAGIIIIAF